jgi:hypothetical protein
MRMCRSAWTSITSRAASPEVAASNSMAPTCPMSRPPAEITVRCSRLSRSSSAPRQAATATSLRTTEASSMVTACGKNGHQRKCFERVLLPLARKRCCLVRTNYHPFSLEDKPGRQVFESGQSCPRSFTPILRTSLHRGVPSRQVKFLCYEN